MINVHTDTAFKITVAVRLVQEKWLELVAVGLVQEKWLELKFG